VEGILKHVGGVKGVNEEVLKKRGRGKTRLHCRGRQILALITVKLALRSTFHAPALNTP
jgi:hypothetical protein